MPTKKYRKETFLIHGKFKSAFWNYKDHLIPPISACAAYRLESAERGAKAFLEYANPEFSRHDIHPIYIYDRLDEPTRSMLEENLAYAEGGEIAVCFASGMGAVSAAFGICTKSFDEIISHKIIYGCTYSLLKNWYPRYNISVKFRDLKKIDRLSSWISKKTRVIYFETPSNPNLEIIDIAAITKIVKKINENRNSRESIKVIIDNTFASPYCQRPLEFGVDIVVHSLTKSIGGFGTDVGGAVITYKKYERDLLLYRKDFGAPLSPRNAWSFLVYGLPTLYLRIERERSSAMRIANYLKKHKLIDHVNYPGLSDYKYYEIAKKQMIDFKGRFSPGMIIYFVLKGKPNKAKKIGTTLINYIAKNALSITLAVSLGQIKTLIEHPASMTHALVPPNIQRKIGIDPGGIRLSVGLEDPKDIIRDLDIGLRHCEKEI